MKAHSKIDKINMIDYRKEPIVVTIPTKTRNDKGTKSPEGNDSSSLQPKHRTLTHTVTPYANVVPSANAAPKIVKSSVTAPKVQSEEKNVSAPKATKTAIFKVKI